jgi:hypothetical protein
MSETSSAKFELDVTEADVFAKAISDEALEVAGGTLLGHGNAYTVAFCTGGLECTY